MTQTNEPTTSEFFCLIGYFECLCSVFYTCYTFKTFLCFFPRGTLKFSSVLEAGTSKRKAEIMDLQKRLQFDDPINIQFTSVSYLLFGRKKENLHLRYPTFRTLLGPLYLTFIFVGIQD